MGKRKTPYRNGKKYFVAFLTETSFRHYFDAAMAELFYTTIRCGLLHQTEADGTSRVKRGGLPLVAYTVDHKGIVVNTPRFHDLLEEVISDYAQQLRDPASGELRANFRRKMRFICRIEEEPPEQPLS